MNYSPSPMKTTVWILALLLAPLLIVTLIPQMHGMDIATFNAWLDSFTASQAPLSDIYKNSSANYPILGTAVAVGTLGFLKSFYTAASQDFWAMAKAFRYTLSLFDFANALLVFYFLRTKNVAYAGITSLFFVLTPSTWAPASVWGQIEGFSQLVLFITTLSSLKWFEAVSAKKTTKSFHAYAFLTLIGFVAMIFAKQTLVFAMPCLLMLIAYNVYQQWDISDDTQKTSLTWSAAFAFSVYFILDYSLNLPNSFKSQLSYLWTSGLNAHSNQLSLNGFNVWSFIGDDPSASSLEPLFFGLSAKYWGFLFFGVASVYALIRVHSLLKRSHRTTSIPATLKSAHILLLFSFAQLAANLLLTGTHERYLYHFYPLFFVSTALLWASKQMSFKSVVTVGLGSLAYGLFNWSILFHTDDLSSRWEHVAMFVIHAYFFGHIAYQDWRLSKIEANMNKEVSFDKIFEMATKAG